MLHAAAPAPHFAGDAPRRVRPRASMAGVSLLEMLLVVALIAVVSLLSAMAMGGGRDGMRLRGAAKEVAAQLRHARTVAISTGTPQSFSIDPRQQRWEGAKGRHGTLPDEVAVAFTGAREVQPQAGVGAIRFFDDGASTGGRIDLSLREAAWRIEVSWITGEVRVGPRPEPAR